MLPSARRKRLRGSFELGAAAGTLESHTCTRHKGRGTAVEREQEQSWSGAPSPESPSDPPRRPARPTRPTRPAVNDYDGVPFSDQGGQTFANDSSPHMTGSDE